jgi:predicted kinase
MIHGYLGTGKTTFARQLEQDLPAIRFTHDEWMARLYGEDPPVEHFADYYARVRSLIDSLWPRCLELGSDVVLDLNFWSRRERDEARRVVAAFGATCCLRDQSAQLSRVPELAATGVRISTAPVGCRTFAAGT